MDERSCRLLMSVDSFDWPIFILATLGVAFGVEQHPAFRDHLRAIGELFVRAVGR